MTPRVAVDNIPKLLVSINGCGSQDHVTFLAAYKKIDEYLELNNIKQLEVVLSDGHYVSFLRSLGKIFQIFRQRN